LATNGDSLAVAAIRGGRYNIPKRELTKREISRLIIDEGLSNDMLCEKLSLPHRTLERYLSDIFSADNMVLLAPSAEALSTQTNIFVERLSKQRMDVLDGIANNSGIEPDTRLEAHRLAAEIDHIIMKIRRESACGIARHIQLNTATTNNELVQKQRGLNLELKKNP
jgi:hypothetical protein